jgi:hypothetical protein
VLAKSGSAADIQAAVNVVSAAGGGIVYIPAGNWTWDGQTVTIPSGVNIIGTGLAGCNGHPNFVDYVPQTILYNIFPQGSPSMPTMFEVNSPNPYPEPSEKPTRISGIEFVATAPANATEENDQAGEAIVVNHAYNCRIDHCTFINFCNIAVSFSANSGWNTTSCCYGVIDHCVVNDSYKLSGSGWSWGYGFYAGGDVQQAGPPYPSGMKNWNTNITDFLGRYGPIPSCALMYVEDCHFSYCRHSTDGIAGGWDVVRYNLFDNPYPQSGYGEADLHGSGGGSWDSGRGVEIYNNTFVGAGESLSNQLAEIRGGGGVIFNNTFEASADAIEMANETGTNGWIAEQVEQLYIWDNTLTNVGSLLLNDGNYVQNVNYFLRAPNRTQDGFTYTPYPYPNPRTLGSQY